MMQAVRATPFALQVLLGRALDYAGLFPPASLSLEEAAVNYAKYREQPESWMLGKFICPVARMRDLVNLLGQSPPPSSWQVSALGTGGDDAEVFLRTLAEDLNVLENVAGSNPRSIAVPSLEVRWPAAAFVRQDESEDFLHHIADTFAASRCGITELFFELPAPRFNPQYSEIAQSIRLHNDTRTAAGLPSLGAKIRCGGTEPEAFPSPEEVAAFISACTLAGIPFKATAGLHHPLYHYNAEVGAYMHGFLNVFSASILMSDGVLNGQTATELLADGDASHFDITTEELAWKGHSTTADAIVRARTTSITSFGSCSFDEPRDDLRDMGFM